MTHIRLPDEIAKVVSALCQEGGLYPEHAGRSAAQVSASLIRESATFQRAKKQIASERNPRPGAAVRTG